MALYGAEARGMRMAERRKANVLEMKCLRNLLGASKMDRVRNEEVCRRAVIGSGPVEWIREFRDCLDTWRKWMSTVWREEC